MKRTLVLLGLFLLLGGGTYMYLNNKPEKASYSIEDYRIYFEDTDRIHKIFIANRKGETRELTRKDDYWLYKGKKTETHKVNILLETIRRQRTKFIPPNAMVPGVVKEIASQGLKVELYDENNEQLIAYYVGGVTQDERGTFMILEGSEQPLVMHIPSWDGNISGRYWSTEENWLDRSIFAYEKEDIKSVAVEYPRQKNKSFVIERKNGKDFSVRPFYEVTPVIKQAIIPNRVDDYLDHYKLLMAEAFRNESSKRDSISSLVPFSIVTVTDKNGNKVSAKFHPQKVQQDVPDNENNRSGAKLRSKDGYIERYYANRNDEDFLLVQHLVFGKIFWAYESFFR